MKSLNITIPDDLTESEELMLLAKRLRQQSLSGGAKSKETKLIGKGQLVLREIETVIKIKRVSTEKPVSLVRCNCCNTDYDISFAKPVFINYCGRIQKRNYCSSECANTLIEICGEGRASLKRSKLKHFSFGR